MPTKKELKAAEVLANQRSAFEKKVRALLGHVGGRVKKAELDAAFDALQYKGEYGPAAEKLAAEIASREPVGLAIHAQKAAAVAHAEKHAREYAEKLLDELTEHGGDLEAYAPYPRQMNSWDPRREPLVNKHNLVHRLTKDDPEKGYQRYGHAPHYRVRDDAEIERFVENAMRDAALQYDMFICKMVTKVGEVKSAALTGDHVWSYSFLHVVKPDGSEERWKTQQIVNYSKYGRPYYQWPSRLMKGGK